MPNHLADAASPYLLQHKDNPVSWFPWGEEAFAEARRRDVPVMVSIGYSTCHWCHVMARESFQDAATAAELDAGFVAVKVDREEHPEVDAAYMAAASAFTPSLGWPLTVFATPEGRPFFAGTYFPPEPRGGLPAFRQVLAAVREAWAERRDQIDGTAEAVVSALADTGRADGEGASTPTVEDLAGAAASLADREDREYGGFGGTDPAAPKFPVATALRFLQARSVRAAAPEASAVADRALAAMAASELRDPVEGGFFRYATRRDWSVPHYERMLTDNAQLLDVSLDAGREDVARGVARFLIGVLQRSSGARQQAGGLGRSPGGGGFGAAQDSESWIDGVRSEGGYYARDAEARSLLDPPTVDGKVVTGWNGLAIGALARAGARLGERELIDAARRAADAVLEANTHSDGRLIRASLDGTPSRASATLADYGQLAAGLTALATAADEPGYAVRARELVDACIDPSGAIAVPGGGDPVLAEQGVAAPDAASDGDEPSGFAALADAASALWLLGAGEEYRALAERVVAARAREAVAQPLAFGALLRVAAVLAAPPHQVVVVTPDAADPLAAAARGIPADVVAIVSPGQSTAWAAAGFSLFEEKSVRDGVAAAYDCRDFACRLPVTSPEELLGTR